MFANSNHSKRTLAEQMNFSASTGKTDWFEIKNQDGERAVVRIYDEISWYGVTAQNFANEIANITAAEIEVQINSPGGDVFDGIAIYNALRMHSARIVTRVDGVAASAASLVAMAGDERIMMQSSQMMIHEARGVVFGDREAVLDFANVLNTINESMIDAYTVRSGADRDDIAAMVKAETWFTANEAVEAGLADTVIDPSNQDEVSNKMSMAFASASSSNFFAFNTQGDPMSGTNKPGDAAPSAAPPAPAPQAAAISVQLNGIATSDVSAIQAHIDTLQATATAATARVTELETVHAETVKASRTAWVKALLKDSKITAPQEAPIMKAINSGDDDTFKMLEEIYAAAPAVDILTAQGAGAGDTNAADAAADKRSSLERQVQMLKNSGAMTPEQIANSTPGKALAALGNKD